ncbi:MAG: hypothetical protein IJQ25_04665 [Oscillibacter sp.]|nr:hypothetical protein [Oscillibacter sp.]
MKIFKRLFCVLLALAILSATAARADNGMQFTVCGVQRLNAGTAFDPDTAPQVSTARPGDIVVLTIGFRNASAAAVNLAGFSVKLLFDPEKVSPYSGSEPFPDDPYQFSPVLASRAYNWIGVGNATETFVSVGGGAVSRNYTVAPSSTLVLAYVAFRVNADASGAADFSFGLAGGKTKLTYANRQSLTPVAPAFSLPVDAYAITAVDGNSVTLVNPAPVTLSVARFDAAGKFLSAELQPVPANAGTVSVTFAAAQRVSFALLDSACRPLCVYE